MEEQQSEGALKKFYRTKYKTLLIIPVLLLVLSLAQIGLQTMQTGDFINKGVSLAGGLTLTINKKVNVDTLSSFLEKEFPEADISVRALSQRGSQVGTIVEASGIDSDSLVSVLQEKLELQADEFSVEVMGGSLGESFFKETFRVVIVAFLFMGLVVFLYFGQDLKSKFFAFVLTMITMPTVYFSNNIYLALLALVMIIVTIAIYIRYSIPSFAVILSAFTDIVITMAIINVMGIKLSTAGIAAFLMLIGYSVDTDILLSTKVLKRKEGTVYDRVLDAMKTGLTMSMTTVVAVVVALGFAQSEVLKQIMTILLVGLIIDLPSTWLQNAGILRWYLERKHGKN